MLRFLPTVAVVHGVALLLVMILAVASLLFTNSSMVNLAATIAQIWLSLNLGAVSGSGEVVSALPTLPGFVFLWAIATRVHRAVKDKISIADLLTLTGLILAVPLVLALVACLTLVDASSVLNVGAPPVLLLLRVVLFHLSALFLGMGPRLWQALARRYGAPEWLIDAINQAFRFLIAFATVSLVITLVMTAIHYETFTETFSGYEDTTSVILLLVMSLLYLPNIVIFTMGILVGSPLYFGDASISVFSVHTVPLPPLPILAALPSDAPSWAVAFLVIPAIIATWVCLRSPMKWTVNVSAAVFAGIFFMVAAVFAGGQLGVYGYVGLNLLSATGLVAVYVLIVGLLVAGIDKLRNPAPVVAKAEKPQEVSEEPEPEQVEQEELQVEPEATEEPQEVTEELEDSEPEQEEPEVTEEVEEEPEETKVQETNDGSKEEDL